MKYSSKTFDLSGKTITLETGVLANQATGSVLARIGETMILVTVVMGQENPNLDYFPLTVEYVERLYAGGRIKGSRWVKREGRPTDEAILKARLIDRSIRPFFPKEFKKEVQVVITVLSVDGENDPDILSLIATSSALSISKIPWNGPVGAIRIGLIGKENGEHEFIANPDCGEIDSLELDLVVTSKDNKVIMMEAAAKQIKEETMLLAINKAREWNEKIISVIKEWTNEIGEKKETVVKDKHYENIVALIEKSFKDDINNLIDTSVGKEVSANLDAIVEKVGALEKENTPDKAKIKKAADYVFKRTIRENIVKKGKRPDGRKIDEIRPISVKVGVLPRTHGSAIFARGETQVLTVVTLGTSSFEQLIEGPEGEEAKRYIHHYSMPPYSVGEAGRMGAISRREIGHGALAEKALLPVIPSDIKFPYVIRVVSEVMSSNGSTSMASTCGSTLSLMDAGVPISSPVAGVAIGLMSDKEKYVVLSDIIGLEDFSGDMDFKVAGTEVGITAIQLDVKNDGLTEDIIRETLNRALSGRLFILDKMNEVIKSSRSQVSKFAPKIKVIKIDSGKIGEVIGSGGRVIRNIIATTGATVDVDEDGNVTISSIEEGAVEKAVEWIELLTREILRGEVFEGKVKRILPFGAMVEIVPGKEGLVHVSEMSTEYVNNPADVVKIGQTVKVRVKETDEQGRINLSMVFGEKAVDDKRTDNRPMDNRRPSYGRQDNRFPRKKRF